MIRWLRTYLLNTAASALRRCWTSISSPVSIQLVRREGLRQTASTVHTEDYSSKLCRYVPTRSVRDLGNEMKKRGRKVSDKINHPDHYTAGKIEVYDFIEAWNLDFSIGNVVKYVARAPYKGTKLDDLKKAKWYLEKAIEREERAVADRVADALDGKNLHISGASQQPLTWHEISHSIMFDTRLELDKLKREAQAKYDLEMLKKEPG